MSVAVPKIYIQVETDGGTLEATGEAIHTKFTKPVTASIGGFEIKVAHGSGSNFGKYSDANVFKNVDIWLGSETTGSSKIFAGKIDTFKSEFGPDGGYVVNFTGRDLGEALFRHKITADYFGYIPLYPSPRMICDSGSYFVYSLENYTGSATDVTTLITVGTHAADSLFHMKPYGTTADSFGNDLPGMFGTGSVSLIPMTATGSDYEVHLKLINASAYAHSGKMYAQLYTVEETGSMSGSVPLSSWYGGTVIDFPASENFVVNDTISINLPYFAVENKYIYLQLVWKVTTEGTDPTAGVKVEWAQSSFLNIPNDMGLATNVVIDILSGSGISTGSLPWDDTPLTQSYTKKKAFDALREIADIVNWDNEVDTAGLFNAWTRQSHTNDGLLQTGSNIFTFIHMKDVDAVKNNITVLGALESMIPSDGDYWTEFSGSGWSVLAGSIDEAAIYDGVTPVYGSRVVGCWTGSDGWTRVQHTIDPPLNLKDNAPSLIVQLAGGSAYPLSQHVFIRLKRNEIDTTNYFEAVGSVPTLTPTWTENTFVLGEDNTTGSSRSGQWTKYGMMNWADIKFIEFSALCATPGGGMPLLLIDGLHFAPLRWSGSAIDATSTGSYGLRPYQEESDYFHSDSECQTRAEYLLARLKEPPNQYQVLTTGSEGINPGDRIQLFLPSEGMTEETYYDVIELQHTFDAPDGFITELMLSDSQYIRDVTLLKEYGVLRAYGSKSVDAALRGDRVY